MFDIGFSEIVVCAIVALIVIGPERMPETVRTVGLWIGRLKRSLRETRVEIERQMGVDDIRRQLHNEEIMRTLEDARKDIHSVIDQAQAHNIAQPSAPYVYSSEPELPDHAHMHEQIPESTQPATAALSDDTQKKIKSTKKTTLKKNSSALTGSALTDSTKTP